MDALFVFLKTELTGHSLHFFVPVCVCAGVYLGGFFDFSTEEGFQVKDNKTLIYRSLPKDGL